MQGDYYYRNDNLKDFVLLYDNVNREMLSSYRKFLESRPMKTELPSTIGECGVVAYEFLLDFGSFRDLQRHRAVIQRMPLLTATHGFNEWYFNAMPDSLREKAKTFIAEQEENIEALGASDEIKQYYLAMGYRVACRLSGDLKALVYLAELRSTRFVHPTLVEQMLKMIASLKELFSKDGLVFHLDEEPNRFDIKRGEQTITAK